MKRVRLMMDFPNDDPVEAVDALMDRVIHDRIEVIVTRKKREAVVMISLDEYNAIQETLHLQKSPENARRLQASIAQLNAGQGTERDPEL